MAARIEIEVNKASEVPLRRQLAEQIVYLIATDKLKPGEALPSVRQLARRLKIHHNTVSEAYQELVRRTWVVGRRGSRLIVSGRDAAGAPACLDDLINQTIRQARASGYSLQKLRDRVRERLLAEPPDHILVVEEEPGLRRVLEDEIRGAGKWPVKGCSRTRLAFDPGRVIGALIATPQYALADVEGFAPKYFPAVPLAFSDASEQLARIRKLREPSVVAVVSVSRAFLAAARSLLAPAIGERHSLAEYQSPLENAAALTGADLVFCDTAAHSEMRSKHCVLYRLIASESLTYLMTAMESYQAE